MVDEKKYNLINLKSITYSSELPVCKCCISGCEYHEYGLTKITTCDCRETSIALTGPLKVF